MTDGIIQQAIKNTISKRLFKEKYTNTEMLLTFKVLQQELIEKIKQEFTQELYRDKDGLWGYPEHPSIEFILERLIGLGDNKE